MEFPLSQTPLNHTYVIAAILKESTFTLGSIVIYQRIGKSSPLAYQVSKVYYLDRCVFLSMLYFIFSLAKYSTLPNYKNLIRFNLQFYLINAALSPKRKIIPFSI